MSRLEKYRKARNYRRRLAVSLALFFLLLALGTGLTDYSVNSLMKNEQGFGMFSLENTDSMIRIGFMNRSLYLDKTYMNKDIQKLRNHIEKLLGLK